MGRPSDFTEELAERICERLADGVSLKDICAGEDMPGRTTVWRWINEHESFRNAYARAREDQADTLADEIVGIADSDSPPDDRRVRVDARKWVAAKLRPRAYGDKVTQEHTGTIQAKVTVEYVDSAARSVPLPAGASS